MNKVEQTKTFLKDLNKKVKEIIQIKYPLYSSEEFAINYDNDELLAVIDHYNGCGEYETIYLEIDFKDLERDAGVILWDAIKEKQERLEKKKELKEKLMQSQKKAKEEKEKSEYERLKKKFG